MISNMRVRATILNSIIIIMFFIAIGAILYYYASKAIMNNMYESLAQIADQGAKAVEKSIEGSLEVIEIIAADERINNPDRKTEEKLEMLKYIAAQKGFTRMSIADKSFIDGILSPNGKSNLTGSIINIAHELGLEVIAEGVEKEEQLKYLKWYNCDMVQGYLFSRPLPEEEAVGLIL